MVDAAVSNTADASRVGSSPTSDTLRTSFLNVEERGVAHSVTKNLKSGTRTPGSGTRTLGSGTRTQESRTRNLESRTKNLQSRSRTPQSRIQNTVNLTRRRR